MRPEIIPAFPFGWGGMVLKKVLLLGDARKLADRLAGTGFRVTYDPGQDVAAVVSDASACRFAPQGVPLLVITSGGIADWSARQARPDGEFVTMEEALNRLTVVTASSAVQLAEANPERRTPGEGVLVLTYANKGGAGKTSTAVALAVTLAEGGVPTVLCDFDLGGPNLADFFGLSGTGIEGYKNGYQATDLLQKVHNQNLNVLCGPHSMDSPSFSSDELVEAVAPLRARFPVIVGDTPPEPWTRPYIHGLFANADLVYAVIDQSKFSAVEAKKYAPTLGLMGVAPERTRIVVNQYNPKLMSVSELRRQFCAGFKRNVPSSRLPRVTAVVPEIPRDEHVRLGYRGRIPDCAEWGKMAHEVAVLAGAQYQDRAHKSNTRQGWFSWLKLRRT